MFDWQIDWNLSTWKVEDGGRTYPEQAEMNQIGDPWIQAKNLASVDMRRVTEENT